MGFTRTDLYTDAQNELATIAKALGHPARIVILQELLRCNSCVCGDLVAEIGLAQPTVSQHLKELKRVGLIRGIVEGTRVCYCIDTQKLKMVKAAFMGLFGTMDADTNNCC